MNNLNVKDQSFGPIQHLIDDEAVEEIWINSPSRIFVARDGKDNIIRNTLLPPRHLSEIDKCNYLLSSNDFSYVATPPSTSAAFGMFLEIPINKSTLDSKTLILNELKVIKTCKKIMFNILNLFRMIKVGFLLNFTVEY
ncbi:MAG: hypothetical protein RJB29_696, partial [Actinomycetota bacterium]